MLGNVMGNQKSLGFKISEISELARMEFEKKKNSTRNHLGKPDKKITDSILRQLKEHEKILKINFDYISTTAYQNQLQSTLTQQR
jgi:hypothetical protein